MPLEWTGTPEEIQAAIGQIEANALAINDLRELARHLDVRMPKNAGKDELAALVLAALRNDPPPDSQISASLESAPEPGPAGDPGPGLPPAGGRPEAEMLVDEDLDVVRVLLPGHEGGAGLIRRLGGVRGARQAKIVSEVRREAEEQGYVLRKCMRRVNHTDYGV